MTKCKYCGKEIEEVKWLKVPELKIEVELEVHDKSKSWDELKLDKREKELLTVEEAIWLANSEYADELKMFSGEDDFFIQQPFKRNRKINYIAGFVAYSAGAALYCLRHPDGSLSSLGVRFKRKLKGGKNETRKKYHLHRF